MMRGIQLTSAHYRYYGGIIRPRGTVPTVTVVLELVACVLWLLPQVHRSVEVGLTKLQGRLAQDGPQ